MNNKAAATGTHTSDEPEYGRWLLAYADGADFSKMGQAEVEHVVSAVTKALDSGNIWIAFKLLTKALETSKEPEVVLESMRCNATARKLRDTWLAMHGKELKDHHSYTAITGEGGYRDYRRALDALNKAVGH